MKKFLEGHFFIFSSADKRFGLVFIKRDGWYLDINLGYKFIMIWFGRRNKCG